VHLTERAVKAAEAVPGRKTYLFDDDCQGFALSISAACAKRFVLDYTVSRRQRRVTIGAWPAWSVTAAREEAQLLKREVDRGIDPLDHRVAVREAKTIADLARFASRTARGERADPPHPARRPRDGVTALDLLPARARGPVRAFRCARRSGRGCAGFRPPMSGIRTSSPVRPAGHALSCPPDNRCPAGRTQTWK